ncbi:unnamed protein product [Rhodiola kirilowii]
MCIFIIYDKITDKKACREYSILIPIQMYRETYGLLLRHWGTSWLAKSFHSCRNRDIKGMNMENGDSGQ